MPPRSGLALCSTVCSRLQVPLPVPSVTSVTVVLLMAAVTSEEAVDVAAAAVISGIAELAGECGLTSHLID